jgi:hypothetical protein
MICLIDVSTCSQRSVLIGVVLRLEEILEVADLVRRPGVRAAGRRRRRRSVDAVEGGAAAGRARGRRRSRCRAAAALWGEKV